MTRRELLGVALAGTLMAQGKKVRLGMAGFDGHPEEIWRPLAQMPEVELVAIADAGSAPDARAVAAARSRDVVVEGAARQVTAEDFARFDLLLAMDRDNERELLARAPDAQARAKVRLLREFDPASDDADLDVPDPYYGGDQGFEDVLDQVEAACRGLIAELRAP